MENLFERTMLVCLNEKRSKNPSKLDESLKKVKRLTEADEADLSPDEDMEDIGEIEDPEAEMGDIQDDIMVVVDPEKEADEVEGAASEAQSIVDNTPEGETPTTDEYVGDKTYTCPICGNTFFSEVEMNEGDTCPVCGETPSGFVLVGEVASTEDAGEEPEDDAPVDEEIPEDDGEDLEEVEDEEDLEEKVCPKCKSNPCECKDEKKESIRRTPARRAMRPRYQIDESTFNPYMNRFIRENYKNARSFKLVGASLNKNAVLTLECVITFKSGKTKKVNLKTEGFREFNGKRAYIDFKEDGAFKTESKSRRSPFVFTTSMKDGIIKCEGMSYNFVSKISEGKRSHVHGEVVFESARNFRRGDRK